MSRPVVCRMCCNYHYSGGADPKCSDVDLHNALQRPRMSFTVPGPPVPCERARTVRSTSKHGERVRTFTPDRTAKYKKHVAMFALQAVQAHRQTWPKEARYSLTIRIFSKEARGDGDNFRKGIQDACRGVLWVDDSRRYIVRGTDEFPRTPEGFGIDKKNPRVEIEVEVVG